MEYKDAMKIFIGCSVILGVVLIIITYLGVFRYYTLKFQTNSIEKYITNFKNLPKTSHNKTILSVSTNSKRLNSIQPMIKSLLDQTMKVDSIILVIPVDQINDLELPDYLKGVVSVVPAGKDYGEGNAIIPILLVEKECDTKILAVQDDTIYGRDCMETFLKESKDFPNTVLTDKSRTIFLFQPTCFDANVINRDKNNFDNDWFLDQAKNSTEINYNKNFKYKV